MTLTFPTQAEQALAEFNGRTKTVSLTVIAKSRGGERKKFPNGRIEYTFDDDTVLTITGRGRSHCVTTELP